MLHIGVTCVTTSRLHMLHIVVASKKNCLHNNIRIHPKMGILTMKIKMNFISIVVMLLKMVFTTTSIFTTHSSQPKNTPSSPRKPDDAL